MFPQKQTQEVTTFTTLLVAYLFLPLIFFLLTPIYIFRLIVQFLAKKHKPELGEILSDNSSIFATLSSNPTCSGVSCFILEDTHVDILKIVQIGEIILTQPKFIKAKQTLVKWMGFFFWKNNPKFSLKELIILHPESTFYTEVNHLRENDFIQSPFPKDKPLWEMHIFPDYTPENPEKGKTYVAVALRMHHSLLDWFSMIEVAQEINKVLVDNNYNSSLLKKCYNKSLNSQSTLGQSPEQIVSIVILIVKLIVFGPFELVRSFRKCIATTMGTFIGRQPLKQYYSFETRVPLDYVREIAVNNGVKTAAVTLAAMGGALRQLFIDLGVQPVPEKVSVAGPVPLPGPRPEGLNNYFVGLPIQVPTGEEDPFKRVQIIHKEFQSLRSSTKPLAYYTFFCLFGGLFHWMIKPLARIATKSASFTIAPGPSNLNELLGLKIVDFLPSGGMPYGNVVILGFYSLSLNNQLYLRVTGDEVLFSDSSKSKRFIDLVLREFEILKSRRVLHIGRRT